jgi:uncharacterized membrane protein
MTTRDGVSKAPSAREPLNRRSTTRSIFWTGFVLGVGIMAFLFEILSIYITSISI